MPKTVLIHLFLMASEDFHSLAAKASFSEERSRCRTDHLSGAAGELNKMNAIFVTLMVAAASLSTVSGRLFAILSALTGLSVKGSNLSFDRKHT